ncbi:MAG: 50S ribosomal protein L21 [Dehalococcoidia bacterium]
MTDYAIISTGGKQYRVRQGDIIEVEKLQGEVGEEIAFADVLLASVDGSVTVGSPTLDGAKVVGEIAGHDRAPKVTIFKYKNKTRNRVKNGHRQPFTAVTIKEIAAS